MYSIGEFSKLTGLTVKTLRFYHERGILVPARVDSGSGYRHYDQRNVDTARAIVTLRQYGFSLEDIAEILRNHADEEDILDYFEKQKNALNACIARDRELVSCLDRIIQTETQARQMIQQTVFPIEKKSLPPLLVAGIRMKGRYEDCGKGFAKLGRSLGRFISGPPLCLYYDDESREDDADFEPCLPIRKMINVEGVDVRKLDGGNCLSLVHRGSYQELGRSYEKLIRYAKEHGDQFLLPSREVYLKGPGMIFKGNPQKYLTEIQILIETDDDNA